MRKLLYLVTEDWSVVSHFLPMVRTAVAAGFEVVVATRLREHGARIEAEGCRVVALENERSSLGSPEMFRGFARIWRILRDEKPDVVHCISLRMVVLGGIAARLQGVKWLVLAPIGLGHLWLKNNVFEDAARGLSRLIVGRWLNGPGTRYMFENTEDPAEFGLDAGQAAGHHRAGRGRRSAAIFRPRPIRRAPPLKVAVVSRMIEAKGIGDAVEAVRRARALGAPVELDLYGCPIRRTGAPAPKPSCANGRPSRASPGRVRPTTSRASGAPTMSRCCLPGIARGCRAR